MTDKEIFEGEDLNGDVVKFSVKTPGAEVKKSQSVYNKAFKQALDDGALLRQKLTAYMRDQDLWDDAKQKKYETLLEEIDAMEESLQKGGIRLSTAKEIALDLRKKRETFRDLIAERNALDSASAEGQADNARFEELVGYAQLIQKMVKGIFQVRQITMSPLISLGLLLLLKSWAMPCMVLIQIMRKILQKISFCRNLSLLTRSLDLSMRMVIPLTQRVDSQMKMVAILLMKMMMIIKQRRILIL